MALHNVQIARSGVQYYHVDELPALGLNSIPREYKNQVVFGVYRPSHVLQTVKDKITNLPVIVGHTKWVEDLNDPDVKGMMCGDAEVNLIDGELVIKGKIDLKDERVLDSAHELSLGYSSHNKWCEGIAPSGEQYQIVSDKIREINHLAIVETARGGINMKVLDGGSKLKGLHSGLLRFIKSKLKKQADGIDAFTTTVNDVIKNLVRWDEAETEEHANTLIALTSDLPQSEEKEKLIRYISDIPMLKNEDEATVNEAMTLIADLYNQLSKDAINDVIGEPQMEAPVEEKKEPVPASANEEAPAAVQQDAPAESGESEVVTLLKQVLMKLDSLSCAEEKSAPAAEPTAVADSEPEPEEKKEEPKEQVGDGIPMYTQSLGAMNAANSLDDMFAKMKARR